jgi:hypothetical protein
MSVKKKKTVKKESPPSNVQLGFHSAGEIEAAKIKIQKRKNFEKTIDPAIARASRRPGRPSCCDYPSTIRYPLEMPEIYHLFLKEKSKKENVPMRKIILDAVTKVYGKEIDKIIDSYL